LLPASARTKVPSGTREISSDFSRDLLDIDTGHDAESQCRVLSRVSLPKSIFPLEDRNHLPANCNERSAI